MKSINHEKRVSVFYAVFIAVLLAAAIYLCAGCRNKTKEKPDADSGTEVESSVNGDGEIVLYYTDRKGSRLVTQKYKLKSTDVIGRINEVLEKLAGNSSDNTYVSAKPVSLNIVKTTLANSNLSISFDIAYNDLPETGELLLKASYVMTLTQIDGVDMVTFYVNDKSISDKQGNIVGAMKGSDFADNSSDYVNRYGSMLLVLYFANEDGTKLRRTTVGFAYSKNISLERYVVEQLIRGPLEDGNYRTVNSGVRINSVFTKDGICYVDFDDSIMRREVPVDKTIMIYSIVNSLSELSHVNKVQISVNGSTDIMINGMSVRNTISRNLDVIESGENKP